jgi:hypothetical protein
MFPPVFAKTIATMNSSILREIKGADFCFAGEEPFLSLIFPTVSAAINPYLFCHSSRNIPMKIMS